MFDPMLLLYSVPLVLIWLAYAAARRRHDLQSKTIRDAARGAGLTEPASLHPLIDAARCYGCGACTKVCPEGNVLGLIDGKAQLIEPTSCIGHGACKTACPYDAIELVFGTARRGVDIPHVEPTFETNVPGLYIAGELGGMGLIANAVEQGRQAITSITQLDGLAQGDRYDVLIIGAGPAGISASLAARENGLSYITLEQDSFGGTVAHYPRGKLIMTRPMTLALEGKKKFREIAKEDLLSYWQDVADRHELAIRDGVRVSQITRQDNGFEITCANGERYRARAAILAIGRRGSPRQLGVPGEALPVVAYRLDDPRQFRGRKVLVVGGGDSALEAAAALSAQPGTQVTLSYRSGAFAKAKTANRQTIEAASHAGHINVLYHSTVTSIAADHVDLNLNGTIRRLQNDAVFVCTGGVLPTQFLKEIGIEMETKYGTA